MFTGVITTVGAALIAQWASGGTMTITKAEAGSGSSDNLSGMTALTNKVQNASISRYSVSNNSVTMRVSVGPNTSTYTMKQIGIFGKIDNGTERLIAIYQDDTGVEIPSSSVSPDFSFMLNAVMSASGTGTLNVTVDSTSALTQADLNAAFAGYTNAEATTTDKGYMSAADKATLNALAANGNPYIGTNGNWYVYDGATKAFKDSGVYATGDEGVGATIAFEKTGNELKVTVSDANGDHVYTVNVGSISSVSANGTLVASSGAANIPSATTARYGVTKIGNTADTAAAGNHTHAYSTITGTPTFTLDGTDLYIVTE